MTDEEFRAWARKSIRDSGKVADRPHPITVVITLLSTVVAVAAVSLTVRSVRISETSMKVGQRAYLVIRNGGGNVGVTSPNPCRRSLHTRFEIHNLGNTPASQVDVGMRFPDNYAWMFDLTPVFVLPDGTAVPLIDDAPSRKTAPRRVTDIAQKDALVQSFDDQVVLSPDAAGDWFFTEIGWAGSQPLTITGNVSYLDVFGDKHSQTWEWQVAEPPASPFAVLSRDEIKQRCAEASGGNSKPPASPR